MSDKVPLDPINNVVDRLCVRFGTQAKLATAAGCTQSTICGRRKLGSFSHRQMLNILSRAPDMGVVVSPADFFNYPRARADNSDGAAA